MCVGRFVRVHQVFEKANLPPSNRKLLQRLIDAPSTANQSMTSPERPPTTQSLHRSRTGRRALIALLLLTLAVRGSAMLLMRGNLQQDLDAYLGIATQVAGGEGFSSPGTNTPTAFRPPMYPLLLAGGMRLVPDVNNRIAIAVAAVNLCLSLLAVGFTYAAARRWQAGRLSAFFAGLIVAVDPLLVYYATFPMTETATSALSAALLWILAAPRWRNSTVLAAGFVFGLAVLCRPTYWAFGVLLATTAAVFIIAGRWRQRHNRADAIHADNCSQPPASQRVKSSTTQLVLLFLVGLLPVVSPWVVRNWQQFGRPVLMTTHGGYTLLLGNNPVFAREVVDAEFGTVWNGESLQRWQQQLEQNMQQNGVATGDEIARDTWHKQRAFAFIRQNPDTFLRASLLRLRRFWGTGPPSTALQALEQRLQNRGISAATAAATCQGVSVGVTVYYLGLFAAAVAGFLRVPCRNHWPAIVLIVAFCGVHLVYWSNARMRAPVMPALALLAAMSCCKFQEKSVS